MFAKEHYDTHLAAFYSWMAGDFQVLQQKQEALFSDLGIVPHMSGTAIDLGAGHGLQSVSLANLGFSVTAIDFSSQLIGELRENGKGLPITAINGNLLDVTKYDNPKPEIIVCCGDTLTHLDSLEEIECLIRDCTGILPVGGKIVLSFRDYSTEPTGAVKFIPVKSDDKQILTCCLAYELHKVAVYDLLHYKTETGWHQKVSGYRKLRLSPPYVALLLENSGFTITVNRVINGMVYIMGIKRSD